MTKSLFVSMSLVLASFAIAPSTFSQTGQHFGEARALEYSIEYLDPKGVTTADENGITFAPFSCCVSHSNEVLPESYFGDYPLYFSNSAMHFRVVLRNTSRRTFRNLQVEAMQEFLNTGGGAGEEMGGEARSMWFVEELGPGEEMILIGAFNIPNVEGSGIDQTHLRISHASENNFGDQFDKGQVIIDDPQAGLWCPQTI